MCVKTEEKLMFQKHVKAVSLVLVLCLIAAMFAFVAVSGSANGALPEILLLLFVAVACIPVFIAHEKHD